MDTAGTSNKIAVLIHGTFAREASWTNPDSQFGQAIKKEVGGNVTLVRFEWSGKNSHNERLQAGNELAHFIDTLAEKHPGAPIYLIAHSHGGNVAAYALRDESARGHVAGVVCMGTPFIHTENRNLDPTINLLRYVGYAAFLIIIFFLFSFTMLYAGNEIISIEEGSLAVRTFIILLSAGLAYGAAYLLSRLITYLKTKGIPSLKAKQETVSRMLGSTFHDIPVLTIRAKGDEASAWLGFLQSVASVPFRIWSPKAVLWIFAVLLSLYGIIAIVAQFLESGPQESVSALILMSTISLATAFALFVASILLLFLAAMLLCLLLPKIFRGHALGFGEKGFINNWLVAISASPTPYGTIHSREALIELDQNNRSLLSLRHSRLYTDPGVLATIARWLKQSEEK